MSRLSVHLAGAFNLKGPRKIKNFVVNKRKTKTVDQLDQSEVFFLVSSHHLLSFGTISIKYLAKFSLPLFTGGKTLKYLKIISDSQLLR